MKKTLIYIFTVAAIAVLLTVSACAFNQEAYNAVYSGLTASEITIDLTEYNVTSDELSEIFDKIVRTSPELFYVDSKYVYEYSETGTITTMAPVYLITGSDLTTAKSTYRSFISGITSGVKSSWSDLEKALYLHDEIVLRLKYDSSIKDVYNAAKTGKGNCTAYTLTYLAACNSVGISCDIAVSESMQHIWNVVKIDGSWYHVDVTWDDPTDELYGRACHGNFLLSDSAISKEHSAWESDYTCSSTRFDSAAWKNVTSPFVYASDGSWYAVDPSNFTLSCYNLSSSSAQGVAYITDKWPAGASSNYDAPYSGTGVYDDFVYFNSGTRVYAYNVKTGDISVVYTHDSTANYIYYISVNGSTLTYYLATSPSTQTASGTVDLKKEASTYTISFVVNGEIVASYDYAEGASINETPDVGLIDGYVFTGWDSLPESMPAEDIRVNAVFEVCVHKNATNKVIIAATCTTEGEGQMVCTDCGHVINTYAITTSHGIGNWTTITEADCTHDGLRRRYCPTCGEMTEEEVIPAYSAHKFGDWVIIVEATEDQDGERERYCERCGYVDSQIYSVHTDDTADDTTDTEVTDETGTTSPDSTDDTTDTDSEKNKVSSTGSNFTVKDFFVYFALVLVVVCCVTGIVIIYRYAFLKKKPSLPKFLKFKKK